MLDPKFTFGVELSYQCIKHIEMNIHFVREKVAHGDVRVLHALLTFYTKRLSRVLSNDFKDILCIRALLCSAEGVS